MPGHDHHLQFSYQPGDLNSTLAVFNWICPVDGDDSEDITSIFKRYLVVFFQAFSLELFLILISY